MTEVSPSDDSKALCSLLSRLERAEALAEALECAKDALLEAWERSGAPDDLAEHYLAKDALDAFRGSNPRHYVGDGESPHPGESSAPAGGIR